MFLSTSFLIGRFSTLDFMLDKNSAKDFTILCKWKKNVFHKQNRRVQCKVFILNYVVIIFAISYQPSYSRFCFSWFESVYKYGYKLNKMVLGKRKEEKDDAKKQWKWDERCQFIKIQFEAFCWIIFAPFLLLSFWLDLGIANARFT